MGEFDWNDVFGGTVRAKDSVVDKIRKLQALSHSSNEHEAALAASKMQELLFKHNLSAESLVSSSDFVKEGITVNGRVWQENLLTAIARNNFCQPIRSQKMIYVVGKRENTEAVRIMYQWLTLEIDRLATIGYWLIGETTGESSKMWKNGFRNGAVTTLANRLKDQREVDVAKIAGETYGTSSGTEIILKMKNELSVATKQFFPYLTYGHARSDGGYSQGYSAGKTAGGRMALGRTGGNLK